MAKSHRSLRRMKVFALRNVRLSFAGIMFSIGMALVWPGGIRAETDALFSRMTDDSLWLFTSRGRTLRCEVARSSEKQQRGLMFRKQLAADACMAFVYNFDAIRTFRMKNTTIPLSVAFLDARFRVLAVKNMKALDESVTSSDMPTRVVLEANANWFQSAGIQPGDVFSPAPD